MLKQGIIFGHKTVSHLDAIFLCLLLVGRQRQLYLHTAFRHIFYAVPSHLCGEYGCMTVHQTNPKGLHHMNNRFFPSVFMLHSVVLVCTCDMELYCYLPRNEIDCVLISCYINWCSLVHLRSLLVVILQGCFVGKWQPCSVSLNVGTS